LNAVEKLPVLQEESIYKEGAADEKGESLKNKNKHSVKSSARNPLLDHLPS